MYFKRWQLTWRLLNRGFDNAKNHRIPTFVPVHGMSEQSKYSFFLLVVLWVAWLKENVDVLEPSVRLLIPVTRVASELNKGMKTSAKKAMTGDGIVPKSMSHRCRRLDSFVAKEWLFETFIEGVREGKIDVDIIGPFQKHMQDHTEQAKLGCNIPEGTEARHDREYVPKPATKKSQKKGNKKEKPTGDERLVMTYVKVVEEAFTFKEKNESNPKSKESEFRKAIPKSKSHLKNALHYYAEHNAIERVKFDREVLAELQGDLEDPQNPYAKALWEHAKKIEKEVEEKEFNKTNRAEAKANKSGKKAAKTTRTDDSPARAPTSNKRKASCDVTPQRTGKELCKVSKQH
jgi:hypothetical protein